MPYQVEPRWCQRGLLLITICTTLSGSLAAAQPCQVRGWYNSTAVPIVGEISVSFTKIAGHGELSVGFDDHAIFSEFSRLEEDKMDVLIETTYPQLQPCFDADRDSTVLSLQPLPRAYLVGERKVAVVVGSGVACKRLTLAQIGAILAGEDRESQPGPAVPQLSSQPAEPDGFAGLHRYCEPDKSWCRSALAASCMQVVIQKPGYKVLAHHPFRDDLIDCVDGDEVIAKVKRDARSIGFFQYREEQKLDGVHVVPISAAQDKPSVALLPGDVLQPEYPLAEPILLYLHPKAPPLAKEFCEYAVGKEGSAIAEKYGVITAYAQEQAEGEERLREAAAGKGEAISVVGPAQTRGLLRDMEPAYVRSAEVMRMQYVVQTGEAAIQTWHARHGVLILSEADVKKLAGRSADSSLVAAKPVLLASRSVAVVVNTHFAFTSMLPADVKEAFASGKLPAGVGGEGDRSGGALHLFGVDAPDPAAYLFWRGVGGSAAAGSGRVKYERTGQAVIQDVAGDRAGMGFVNATELPENSKGTSL